LFIGTAVRVRVGAAWTSFGWALQAVRVGQYARSLANDGSKCEVLFCDAPRLPHQLVLLSLVAQQPFCQLETRPRLLQQLLLADVPVKWCGCGRWFVKGGERVVVVRGGWWCEVGW
jgi:hypothetical protein